MQVGFLMQENKEDWAAAYSPASQVSNMSSRICTSDVSHKQPYRDECVSRHVDLTETGVVIIPLLLSDSTRTAYSQDCIWHKGVS